MVKIICRVKPPKEDNIKIESDKKIKLMKKDRNLLDNSIIKPYEFELDKVYDYNSSTLDIYDSEIKNYIKINKNIGIFIYGHTGSGKTYTLFGNDRSKGIFDLLCNELNFNFKIQAVELKHSGNFDLFTGKKLLIYSDKNDNVVNNSVKEDVDIRNYHLIKDIIYKSRISGLSKHNNLSSRSHLIINIYDKNNVCYNIIDLAGNERRPDLSSKENEKEVSFINSSLLALKECFRAYNKKHVPYRRSDLTRLLKGILTDKNDYFNLIICTIHSGFPYFFDSVDTLNYIEGLFSKVKKKISYDERKPKYEIIKKSQIEKKINLNKLNRINKINSIEANSNFNNDFDNFSEDQYSDDFYSEPDLNRINNNDEDSDFEFSNDNKEISKDDWNLDPILYSPSKNPKKLKDLFIDDPDPIFINDFASLKDNDDLDYQMDDNKIEDLVCINDCLKLMKTNNPQYKKKLFGILNNFVYKNCVSNYKELLDKDLDDKKISILILNNIATLKLIIKELKSI